MSSSVNVQSIKAPPPNLEVPVIAWLLTTAVEILEKVQATFVDLEHAFVTWLKESTAPLREKFSATLASMRYDLRAFVEFWAGCVVRGDVLATIVDGLKLRLHFLMQ